MIERMSALDTAFLYSETAHETMNLSGLLVLDPTTHPDGNLSLERLTAVIASRIHLVPRLRQKACPVPLAAGRPVWIDDEGFDLSFHVRETRLPAPGDAGALAGLVQRLHMIPLDRSRPLWSLSLIQGIEGDRVALLLTWHHAMADGLSGIAIVRKVLQMAPGAAIDAPQSWRPSPPPSPLDLVADAWTAQLSHPLEAALGLASQDAAALRRRVSDVWEGFGSLRAAGLPAPAPFSTAVGPGRRFAMAQMPVADVRELRAALGTSLNNVVLSLAAGGLAHWLSSRGWRVATLRACVPVSARGRDSQAPAGNQISHFFVDLPVAPIDEDLRLRLVSERASRARSQHQEAAQSAINELWDWAPTGLLAAAIHAGRNQVAFADVVVTHTPGSPVEPFYVAGCRYLAAYPLLPLRNGLAVGIGAVSMAGVMSIGVIADDRSIGDAQDLAGGVLHTYRELRRKAGLP